MIANTAASNRARLAYASDRLFNVGMDNGYWFIYDRASPSSMVEDHKG